MEIKIAGRIFSTGPEEADLLGSKSLSLREKFNYSINRENLDSIKSNRMRTIIHINPNDFSLKQNITEWLRKTFTHGCELHQV